MKNKLIKSLGLLGMMSFSGSALAVVLDFDFSGTFTNDNDIVLLDFTVDTASTITIFSSSWGDGVADFGYVADSGFDPMLAIWDSSGNLVQQQDDGDNVGTTQSNGVDYTHGLWDTYFTQSLTAGGYTASIAQYDNFANGVSLSSGFRRDGNPNFTFDEAFGTQPLFNGVWDSTDARTGDWEFHILNVDSASQVPESATLALFGLGLAGLGFARRKKSA